MILKRTLVVGGLVAALAVPTGVALAASDSTPTPGPTSTAPGPGPGAGYGRMMGGGGPGAHGAYGDPEDCPFYDSAEAQAWRDQREARQQLDPAERQKLVQQHREQMWNQMQGTSTTAS